QPTDVVTSRAAAAARGRRLVAYMMPAPAATAPLARMTARTSTNPGALVLASAESTASKACGQTSISRSGRRAVRTPSKMKGAAGAARAAGRGGRGADGPKGLRADVDLAFGASGGAHSFEDEGGGEQGSGDATDQGHGVLTFSEAIRAGDRMTRITGGQPTAQGTSCMPATLHPPWQEDEVLERRTGERGASAVSTAVIDAAPQRRSGVGWESMTQIQPTPDADAARSAGAPTHVVPDPVA